ncbi:MAG: Aminodeoxyfutalosine synthase [Chlamydiae bacterium]|nr:Aminodeoxyfutalosine synthase [Chlamydiota bacterium]
MKALPHPLAEKIQAGQRLTAKEGLELLQTKDPEEIEQIRGLADQVRQEKVGDKVLFASTLFIHPTNLCELNCQFCSFYAKPDWPSAWFSSPQEIEEKIRHHHPKGLTEVHIVGGLWRDCNLDYYEELFTRIKNIDPNLHIKALTPVEYDFLAKLHNISVEEVFRKMMSWGLGSLPGGGAEILVEEIREKLAPGKISSDEFLAIHALAHRLGLHSNNTMLFNHVEGEEDIITHLGKVREQQDKTGGFRTFVPLKFGEEGNPLGKRKKALRKKSIPLVFAVSRLMLDNIPNLKVLWNYIGVKEAVEILTWGANDLSSTNLEEKVIDNRTTQMDGEMLSSLIREAGRIPHLTNSGESC